MFTEDKAYYLLQEFSMEYVWRKFANTFDNHGKEIVASMILLSKCAFYRAKAAVKPCQLKLARSWVKTD